MNKFILTCESRYGSQTGIYHYVNPNQVVEIHIASSSQEINVEAKLTSGLEVIILSYSDLYDLVGEDNAKEIREKIEEEINEQKSIY